PCQAHLPKRRRGALGVGGDLAAAPEGARAGALRAAAARSAGSAGFAYGERTLHRPRPAEPAVRYHRRRGAAEPPCRRSSLARGVPHSRPGRHHHLYWQVPSRAGSARERGRGEVTAARAAPVATLTLALALALLAPGAAAQNFGLGLTSKDNGKPINIEAEQ